MDGGLLGSQHMTLTLGKMWTDGVDQGERLCPINTENFHHSKIEREWEKVIPAMDEERIESIVNIRLFTIRLFTMLSNKS